jgi:hypothetical protein
MTTSRYRSVSASVVVVLAVVNACQLKRVPPDITGFVVSIDSSYKERRVRVETDTTDSINSGKGSPKAIVQFPTSIRLERVRIGCVVSVWFDERFPILDSYPSQVVGKAITVTRCE